jgi:hypothetical protein
MKYMVCCFGSKRFVVGGLIFLAALSISCSSSSQSIAFPGAEGFGKYTTGGRGGDVMIVSNLDDNGPGSFRAAVEAKRPRIVVFAVSGTIHLASRVNIASNVTIAGHTAPGDGICIADHPVVLNGDNIIVRYLRFRMGDRYQNGGMVDGAGGDDAFGGIRRKNIIVDHCSISWSTDECFTVYAGDSTTLQWNLVSEPLNYSWHFETGDKDFEHHGFGGIWGGMHTSAHHNLFAHCTNRTPRFNGARNKTPEFVDFRNNVVYNWGINNTYAGEGGNYNVINNYYKYGPSTSKNSRFRFLNPYKGKELPFGKFYVDGNCIDGSAEVTTNNARGVSMNDGTEDDKKAALIAQPFAAEPIITQKADKAYDLVLASVGASFRRDTLDQRIIQNVKDRTGRIIDVQGGYPHATPYEQTVNAWPYLRSDRPKPDTDKDGMPDEWEKKQGLNPQDAKDASQTSHHSFYTNIEMYINSLLPDK